MVDEDLLDGDGETGDGAEESTAADSDLGKGEAASPGSHCLSCGAATIGVFCANCGQKNDDLRRSLFLLARDFVEDTFSFDSRMWRTLGMLAASPGLVPSSYSHGKRSRFTPPVRLFLVVSFLFFLLLGVTQTMFVALEITENDGAQKSGVNFFTNTEASDEQSTEPGAINCNVSGQLRFFVRESDIKNEVGLWNECADFIKTEAEESIANPDTEEIAQALSGLEPEEAASAIEQIEVATAEISPEQIEFATLVVERVISGITTAIENPQSFNAAFNNWLPRVMFLMTPVAALIMGLFIRGRDALFFDHMVLALYSHATAFAIVGVAIVAMQIGVPFAGITAAVALIYYFIASVRRAYGRGWIKTVYSSLFGGLIYIIILFVIVGLIVMRLILG